jgi:hypothetical protein
MLRHATLAGQRTHAQLLRSRSRSTSTMEPDVHWDEPQSLTCRDSEHAQERWLDQEEDDPWGADFSYGTYERRRLPSPIDRDSRYRCSDARCPPPLIVELSKPKPFVSRHPCTKKSVMKMHLRCCMYGVPCGSRVWCKAYACIRSCCNILCTDTSTSSSTGPATLASRSQPSFRLAVRPHPPPFSTPEPGLRDVPSAYSLVSVSVNARVLRSMCARDYVHLGHALVLGDRLYLPNGQQIPTEALDAHVQFEELTSRQPLSTTGDPFDLRPSTPVHDRTP